MSIDISKLDAVQLDRFIHLQALIDRQEEAAGRVRAARDYYNGDHPVLLTQRQQEYLGPLLTEGAFGFNHNLIKSVIDTLRERIAVSGFTVNGKGAGDATEDASKQLAALLWQWWNSNQMDAGQIDLYKAALRDGRGFIIVDYDSEEGRPRYTVHEVDDGKTGVVLHRDPGDKKRVLFATRYFYTFDPLRPGATGKERKTVYLPGEIRKYERGATSGASNWQPVMDEGDLAWPIPWADSSGRPLGVAVVEFENPDGSEVAALAGLQNALNKTWLDILASADAAGFPILAFEYASEEASPGGIDDDEDLEDGDEFIVAPGRSLEIFGGRVHRIEGGEIGNLTGLMWNIVSAISGISRTPHSYLRPIEGATVPSGESLKQLESGLVKRALERHLRFDSSWSEVARLAIRINSTFGQGPDLPKGANIAAQWSDPNTRHEKAEAEIAKIHKDLGVPDPAVWRRAGYAPEEIAQFTNGVTA